MPDISFCSHRYPFLHVPQRHIRYVPVLFFAALYCLAVLFIVIIHLGCSHDAPFKSGPYHMLCLRYISILYGRKHEEYNA